jgi:hypothetical protein
MRKNISWTKKIALAVAAGAIMVAGSVSAMAAGCNHIYKDGEVFTVESTCLSQGYTIKVCKLCGEIEKTAEPAVQHQYNTPVTVNNGNVSLTYRICKNCDYIDVVKSSVDPDASSNHDFTTLVNPGTGITGIGGSAGSYKLSGLSEDGEEDFACAAINNTIKICKNCGLVQSTVTVNADHNLELVLKVKPTEKIEGHYELFCKNDYCGFQAPWFTAANTNCASGNHKATDEKPNVCKDCGADLAAASEEPATPAPEDPAEEPAETKVSSGTVVGGGIAAAGILTLITLIVKYLGSVLF